MSQIATFSCPSCGQQFDWQPNYAGRNLICACGQMLQVPADGPALVLDRPETSSCHDRLGRADGSCTGETPVTQAASVTKLITSYDLKEESLPGKLSLDAAGQEIPDAKAAPVLDYRRTTAADVARGNDRIKSQLRDVWVPVGIIAIGFVAMMMLALACNRSRPTGTAIAVMCLRIGWDIGITLLGGVLIYWMTNGALGAGNTPLLKLTALAIGRQTAWAIIGIPSGNVGGDFLGLMLSIPVFLFLFSYLFEECDFGDAAWALVLISLMRWISYFGLWKLL